MWYFNSLTQPDAPAAPVEEEVVHEENDWGISLVDEGGEKYAAASGLELVAGVQVYNFIAGKVGSEFLHARYLCQKVAYEKKSQAEEEVEKPAEGQKKDDSLEELMRQMKGL